jgi:hypothetical protein
VTAITAAAVAGDDGALRQEAWAHWGIRMDNVAMLFVCLAIGMALRKFRRIPDNAHTTINAFIINVALPALVLQSSSTRRWSMPC